MSPVSSSPPSPTDSAARLNRGLVRVWRDKTRRWLGRTLVLSLGLLSACTAAREHVHSTGASAALRLSAERQEETRDSGGATELKESESILKQTLLLATGGFVYHPKFIEFAIKGELGLNQRSIRASGAAANADRSVDANSNSYNLSATLFKDLPYTGNFYTYRTITTTRQSFFGTSQADVRATGVNVIAKDWWIPSRLNVERYKYRGSGLNTFGQDRDSASLQGTRIEDDARYEYSIGVDDETIGTTSRSYSVLRANASTMHLYGAEKLDRWTNSVRFQKQTGDVQTQNEGFSSLYHTQLSDDLTSDTTLVYSRTSSPGATTKTWTASPGITHQLFESLTSSLTVRSSRSDFDGGEVDANGVLGELNYIRRTPVGPLRLRHAVDYFIQDQQSSLGNIAVIDESHTFLLGQPILLNNTKVAPGTVVVTDATGLVVYVEGLDYSLSVQGLTTSINVLAGGFINLGDALLVDYDFSPASDLRYKSLSQSTSFGLRIHDMVQLSYGRHRLNQTLLSGFDEGTLEDSTRTTAGVHVYEGGGMVGVEREQLDSLHTPFERTSYVMSYQTMLAPSVSWRIAADRFRTQFRDSDAIERGTTASSNLVFSLGSGLTGLVRAEWRKVRLRTDAGRSVSGEISIAKHFRSSEVALTGSYTDNQFDVASDTERLNVEVSFLRRF